MHQKRRGLQITIHSFFLTKHTRQDNVCVSLSCIDLFFPLRPLSGDEMLFMPTFIRAPVCVLA